jgi:enterochelin esterase-like enzyme
VVAGHSMGGLVALALATNWFGVRVQRVAAFSVKIEWTPGEIAKFHQLLRSAGSVV